MGLISNLLNKIFNRNLKLNSGNTKEIKFSNQNIENLIKTLLVKRDICEKENINLTLENLSKIKSICFEESINQIDLDEIMKNCTSIKQLDFRSSTFDNIDISKYNIEYLNLFNIICTNFNVNNPNIKGMMISGMNLKESKLSMPTNVKDLTIYDCNNIDMSQMENINPERFAITSDVTKRNRTLSEVENIDIISKMNNIQVMDLTDISNANELVGRMENIKKLSLRNCELKNIEGFSERFPNVTHLVLRDNPITTIKPLLSYEKVNLNKMHVNLENTSIMVDDADLIKECNFQHVDLDYTPLQEDLASRVIVSSSDENKKELSECLNEYIFDGASEDITEWVRYQILLGAEREEDEQNIIEFKSEIASDVLGLDFVVDTADEMEIKINNNTNIEDLLDVLANNKGKKDRKVKFIISKISDISKQYLELLNSRYGITYRFEDDILDNHIYHIDELQNVSKNIDSLVENINKEESDTEKIEEIDNIIKSKFLFLLPERKNYSFDAEGLKEEDQKNIKILNSMKYVANKEEIDKYNNLYYALKDKRLTSKSFINMFYEIADRVDLNGSIDYRLLYNEPAIITINTKNKEGKDVVINLNGIEEIDKQIKKEKSIDYER